MSPDVNGRRDVEPGTLDLDRSLFTRLRYVRHRTSDRGVSGGHTPNTWERRKETTDRRLLGSFLDLVTKSRPPLKRIPRCKPL